jgi:glutathione-regulated potassium-efflux system ancillary protein KefG
MMKHWMDEVLSFGWAYGEGAKLEGKRWAHAITVGATESEYGAGSSRKYTVEEFLHPFERAAHFCGMEFLPPLLFYGSGIVDDQLVQTWSKQYQTWLLSL